MHLAKVTSSALRAASPEGKRLHGKPAQKPKQQLIDISQRVPSPLGKVPSACEGDEVPLVATGRNPTQPPNLPHAMGDSTINTTLLEKLIADAKASGGSERGTYQTFINRLCEGLGLPPPDMNKEDRALNDYVYERRVTCCCDSTKSYSRLLWRLSRRFGAILLQLVTSDPLLQSKPQSLSSFLEANI